MNRNVSVAYRGQVFPTQVHASGGLAGLAGEQLQDGAFARPHLADQENEPTALDRQGEAAKAVNVVRIPHLDVVENDIGRTQSLARQARLLAPVRLGSDDPGAASVSYPTSPTRIFL